MSRKILIVIDMQNDFITGPLGSKEAQAIIPKVVEKVKSYNSECVYFTKDTHYDNYLETLEGQRLPVPHCIINTEGWRIIDELYFYAEESRGIFYKHTFGYEDWIGFNWSDVEEIELCGVCTDICVVSNALALRMFFPNTKITVDSSCCAGVTPEKHEAALEVMRSCQIDVI